MAARTWGLASWVVLGLCLAGPARAQDAPTATYTKERVTFKSGNLTLVGFLFKPGKPGRLPGLIWNHGSEKDPGSAPQFDAVAETLRQATFRQGRGWRVLADQGERGTTAAEAGSRRWRWR